MELEKQRWEVTYTKHIKQKRKVYQDGLLDLHISSKKVMLYDDCETLLECRVLRKDEVVSCGGTLAFSAFLVDVGDHKPLSSDINTPKFHANQKTSENARPRTNTKRTTATLSPSQKIIREFKRSEHQKYGVPQSSPNTKNSNTTEWQVLYTHQLTKKAKTYHDGFLQLSACGSMARQIKLFDESRKLLDSRFLKKEEVVRSGESISLDGHLVEVGDFEGDQSQTTGSNVAVKLEAGHERKTDSVSNVNARKVHNKNQFTTFEKAGENVNMAKSNMTGLHEFDERANINKPLRNAQQILSVLNKPVQESPSGCASKRMTNTFSSAKKVCKIEEDIPKGTQYKKSSILHQGSRGKFGIEESSEYVETGNFTEHLETCKALTSDCRGHEVLDKIDNRDFCQSNTIKSEVDVDAMHSDEATAEGSLSFTASKWSDNNRNHSKESNAVEALSEMPTFDLGF